MTKQMLAAVLAGMMTLSLTACSSGSGATGKSGTQGGAEAPVVTANGGSATEQESGDYSNWPEKDIHIIYYTKAGSGGDTFLRQLSAALNGKLNGHNIVIENIVDPTGASAWGKVQKAPADGYTLACLSSTIVTADLVGGSPVKYKDFDYAIGLGMDPQYVYCKADKPYNTLGELIDYAKEHPTELNWATCAPTSASTVCSVGLIEQAGIDVNRVVYDTGSDALTAILGSFVDVSVGEYGDMSGEVEAGNIKLLCVFSENRTALDTVPTTEESGFNFVFERPRGIAAPLGTDPALLDRIYEVFAQSYEHEDFQAYLSSVAIDPILQTGEEFLSSYELIANTVTENMAALTGQQ